MLDVQIQCNSNYNYNKFHALEILLIDGLIYQYQDEKEVSYQW